MLDELITAAIDAGDAMDCSDNAEVGFISAIYVVDVIDWTDP